ncbi:hypothetical protein [Fusobacterium ulcerans]|jgi:hypothetical protein|uniref:Uncharacterized protein n=1 Tax=Fusobacterium ulcerans 12-1B TaxID=457404 RepID=H1PSA1_9FUSO|nr:hypothetical protein [Fusobacterium ulcerans]EHO82050.1 hypothetical protein HMPREF0402_01294 [Fusobacterium ulcerans 12-1B]RGY67223.1 hypothetical protein DXA30_01255 [Fusobacterium ulcerans]
MKALNNFDFTLNEAKNMVLHKLATAPIGVEGQIFYNTATKKVNVNNGTVFMEIGAQEIATTSTLGVLMVGNGLKIDVSGKMDLAILDESDLIKAEYLPSYVDDVLEFQNFSSLPLTGEQGKIYVTTDNNNTYRWSGTAYIGLNNPLDYATQAEAEAGTNNTKVMTPQRTKEAVLANSPMKKYTTMIGDGAAKQIVVFHNLNTRDILINLYEGNDLVIADVQITTVNSVTIVFAEAPSAGAIKVVIAG